jgi:hypothetical protein
MERLTTEEIVAVLFKAVEVYVRLGLQPYCVRNYKAISNTVERQLSEEWTDE